MEVESEASYESNDPVQTDLDGNPILEQLEENKEKPDPDEKPRLIQRVGRFATFLNLDNAVIGAGIVSVPSTFIDCGVGPTIMLTLICCSLCYACGNIMINLQHETGVGGLDELALRIFGKPGQIALSILSLIYSYSCTVAYLIIGATKIASWFAYADINCYSTGAWALLVFIYGLAIPIALTIPRKLAFLNKFSGATVICIVMFAFAILIKSIITLSKPGAPPDSVIGFKFSTDLFYAFSVHALTFCLPVVMLPVLAPYNPSPRKRHIVTGWVYLFAWFVVSVPGCLAYCSLGDKTQSDILSSYDDGDVLIIILQIAMFLVVTFSYPCVTQSIMGSFGDLIFHQNVPELLETKQRTILLPIVNGIALILAMFVKDIKPVLGIGGALGGCLVVFAFPSIVRLRTTQLPWSQWNNVIHLILAIFGVVSAVICTYYSVLGAIDSF